MARTCTVCTHPERVAIDQALVGGEPNRAIARRMALSKDAVARHRASHLPANVPVAVPASPHFADLSAPLSRAPARPPGGEDRRRLRNVRLCDTGGLAVRGAVLCLGHRPETRPEIIVSIPTGQSAFGTALRPTPNPTRQTQRTPPMTKTTTPPSPTDRIAQHEAEIAALNARYLRYRSVQPLAPGAGVAVGGAGFDPTRLRAKYEIAAQIDRASIRLEEAKADAARERLAGLADGVGLAAMEKAVAEAATEVAAAEDGMRATRTAYSAAKAALDFRRDRIKAVAADAAAADAARVRWEAELAKDAARLDGVERSALVMGATA